MVLRIFIASTQPLQANRHRWEMMLKPTTHRPFEIGMMFRQKCFDGMCDALNRNRKTKKGILELYMFASY